MKKLILLSLLLNVAMLGAIGYGVRQRRAASAPEFAPITANNETTRTTFQPGQAVTRVTTNAPAQFTWRNVESEDYKAYIANLRAIDCPEETIRDIIFADVNKYYGRKLAALRKSKTKEFKFWKTGNGWNGDNDGFDYKNYRQTEKEKKALLKELLGVDYEKEMSKLYGWGGGEDKFVESLSLDKRDQLQEIQERFQDLQQEVHRKARGYFSEEDQAEIQKIERQRRDEIAKVLSPQELQEYEMRNSQTAQNLKWQLEGFDASEKEFREIFKIRKTLDEVQAQNSSFDPDDKVGNELRAKLQKETEDQIKAMLGETRYKDYQLAQDWEYKNLTHIAGREGLSKDAARKVYDMKKEAEDAVRQIQMEAGLTNEQRQEKLKAIRTETENAVTETLGEKGFKSYKRNAWWIRNLGPK